MRLRRPVGHRLGHRVWLRPDDVRSQVPAIGLQREGEAPRDADQVLRRNAVDGIARALRSWVAAALAVSSSTSDIAAGVVSAKRAARTGKNPSTGAALKIPASTVPKFVAGAKFKAVVDPKAAKRKADKAAK